MNTIISASMNNNVFRATDVLVSRSSAIWGTSATWDTNSTLAFNAIWGTSARGTSAIWDVRTASVGAKAIAINGEQ
ncbi:MAG TPA: hypothetical protein VGP62_17920 [Bryobacteraceae bacterium]|jgi:hypothetical protein|nr:hypothetical protein [Bryobacteraceae bacterium]